MKEDHTFKYPLNFELELGGSLPGFQLRYTTLGRLNRDHSNVVWICHALTGSSDFTAWWGDHFTDRGVFDPRNYFIICANVLGGCYGSTGPLSINPERGIPFFNNFPSLTNRDVVRAFDLLRIELGIARIHTLIGGSLGGQQVLEWGFTGLLFLNISFLLPAMPFIHRGVSHLIKRNEWPLKPIRHGRSMMNGPGWMG